MSTPAPPPYIDPGQMILPGLGPIAGERYRNKNTGSIVTVLGIRQGRYQWVRIRTPAGEGEITAARFQEFFTPYRKPTGRQQP